MKKTVIKPNRKFRSGHSRARSSAHCHTHLGGYKCPKSIEFRTALPLSAAGKVLKGELRKTWSVGREVK